MALSSFRRARGLHVRYRRADVYVAATGFRAGRAKSSHLQSESIKKFAIAIQPIDANLETATIRAHVPRVLLQKRRPEKAKVDSHAHQDKTTQGERSDSLRDYDPQNGSAFLNAFHARPRVSAERDSLDAGYPLRRQGMSPLAR